MLFSGFSKTNRSLRDKANTIIPIYSMLKLQFINAVVTLEAWSLLV